MINVTKSQPAPNCLAIEKEKANGDYKCADVLIRLQEDFRNKCYICEEMASTTLNVEHLRPHRGDKNLKFDWDNLFLSCGHCNNIKLAKFDNILDCTSRSNDVLALLKFEMKPFPKEKVLVSALRDTQEVQSTAELLNAVYNGTTPLKTMESENLRNKILEEIIVFQRILVEYYNDFNYISESEIESLKHRVRKHLSAHSPFTAFKVWIIKSNEGLNREFGELIPSFNL